MFVGDVSVRTRYSVNIRCLGGFEWGVARGVGVTVTGDGLSTLLAWKVEISTYYVRSNTLHTIFLDLTEAMIYNSISVA